MTLTTAIAAPAPTRRTTLLRMVAGVLPVPEGVLARSGGLGVMRQFIGMISDDRTLTDLALSLVAPGVRAAGERLAATERELQTVPADERTQLRYANALTAWGEAGGDEAGGLFETVARAAPDPPLGKVARPAGDPPSGGPTK